MKYLLCLVLLVPLISSAVIRVFGSGSERFVSRLATLTKLLIAGSTLATAGLWIQRGMRPIEITFGSPLRIGHFGFPFVFYLDAAAIVFLGVTAFIAAIIIRYCRYYLHREEGYARFFMTIFLFLFGMNLVVTAGNLDLLFAGWEVVGISSFLLIGFYRERTLPVRNALRAYFVYRTCDIGLLLGVWASQLIFPDTRFSHLGSLSHAHWLGVGYLPLLGFCLLVLLAATGKSAQFPFCFWLPRAMEGPTPSSAIFYGALSIHAGVFLLIRTFPIWHSLGAARIAVGMIGVLSALVSTMAGRAQSNIKGQLAYASITQVGVILLELALGLVDLALLHAAANACLRCYQLLISPSVVAQILRFQGASDSPSRLRLSGWSLEQKLPEGLRSTLYAFALNEGFLEEGLRVLLLLPLNRLAKLTHRLAAKGMRVRTGWLLVVVMLACLIEGGQGARIAAILAAVIMGGASLVALAERESAIGVWNALGTSTLAGGLAVLLLSRSLSPGSPMEVVRECAIYFAGVIPGWLAGLLLLRRLIRSSRAGGDITRFHGLSQIDPTASRWFFVAVLALAAFPLTPTFLGEDILLHLCGHRAAWMIVLLTFTFVVNGVTLLRLYSRICLGPTFERVAPSFAAARIGLPGSTG